MKVNPETKALSFKNISKIVTKQRKQLNAKFFFSLYQKKACLFKLKMRNITTPHTKEQLLMYQVPVMQLLLLQHLALALKLDYHILAQLTNLAGGLSCEKIGVNPIDKKNLLNEAIRLV